MSPAAITISGKGTARKKIAKKRERRERDHRPGFERAAADAMHRLQDDRQYRGLQAKEQRGDRRDVSVGGVDAAQREDRVMPGTTNNRRR